MVYGVLYACRSHVVYFRCMRFTGILSVFEAFPVIFIGHHGLTISQDGLIFLGVGIGTTIGAIVNFWTQRSRYKILMKEWRGFPPPEERLYTAAVGAPLLVIGSFWLGWTGAYKAVPWYVPALSTIVIGASISFIFLSFLVCPPNATCLHVLISTCVAGLPRGYISVRFCERL
jgi:DHA1 family multidrug resistance protein-like MFS transporter